MAKMHSSLPGAAVALLLAAGGPAKATSFVNGDFSDNSGVGQIGPITTLTGWTSDGFNIVMPADAIDTTGAPSVYTLYDNQANFTLWGANNGGPDAIGPPPLGGGFVVALDGDFVYIVNGQLVPAGGPLTQTISGLTPGASYIVSFAYAFGQQYLYNGATIQSLVVSLGAQSFSTPDVAVISHGFSGWSADSLIFTAAGAVEPLSFLAVGNLPIEPSALIAGVSVDPAVPEPASWALLLVGFGLLGQRRLSGRAER